MEYIKKICKDENLEEDYVISKIKEELGIKRDVKIKHLPWNGSICEKGCRGLKYCNGLFIQCNKELVDEEYCKVCKKQSISNSSGKPSAGTVYCRIKMEPLDYIDTNGRKVKPYSVYMKKNGLTRDQVVEVARKKGVTIDEEQFQEFVTKRGRPKGSTKEKPAKNTKESKDSDEDDETQLDNQPSKKESGSKKNTPKKKPVIKKEELGSDKKDQDDELKKEDLGPDNDEKLPSKKDDDDNIEETKEDHAIMILGFGEEEHNDDHNDDHDNDHDDDDDEEEKTEDQDEEEEEEELECEEILYNGATYYKSDANVVYNEESEAIGVWNVNDSCIDFN